MILDIILALIYCYVFFVCLKRFGWSVILLFGMQGLFVIHALFILGFGFNDFLRFQLASYIAFFLGFFLFSKKRIHWKKDEEYQNKTHRHAFIITFLFVVIASVYHYAIVGVPLLSENIDVARFSSKSGLLEIPSRIAVYGPLFLMPFVFSAYNANVLHRKEMVFFVVVVFLLLGLQGNKSSLLQGLAMMLVIYGFLSNRAHLKKFALVGLFAGLFFSYKVFFLLASLSDYSSFLFYLKERFSIILFGSGMRLYSGLFNPDLVLNSAVINDLLQPIGKIFGLNIETLNIQLSREIYGTGSGFTVPVTPGLFAYHSYSYGSIIALFLSFFYGIGYAYIYNKVHDSNLLVFSCICYLLYWIYVGFVSGNIYYMVLNVLVPMFLLVFIYKCSRSLILRFQKNRLINL